VPEKEQEEAINLCCVKLVVSSVVFASSWTRKTGCNKYICEIFSFLDVICSNKVQMGFLIE